MKKTHLLVIILLIVAAGVYFTARLFPTHAEDDFILADTSAVNSILIRGSEGEVQLQRMEDGWTVNGGLRANPTAIDNFLYSFTAIEILGMQNSIGDGNDSVTKILIEGGDRKMNLGFVAGESSDFLYHTGSKRIYRVGLAGNTGARLKIVYSSDLQYWQSRTLIDIDPDDIRSISVFPSAPWGEGFRLERKDSTIHLSDPDRKQELPVDREMALMYFSYFSGLYYESIIERDAGSPVIIKDDPFFRLEIETTDGKKTELRIFRLVAPDGKEDIYYAGVRISGSSLLLKVNYSMLDLLFEDIDSFRQNS